MLCAIFLNPLENSGVVIELVRDFFKRVRIQLEKGEQMFVESDRFVVVTVQQSLSVKPGFVNQPRQMNVTAQSIVWAAGKQSLP